MNRRTKELIDVCKTLITIHDQWVENDNEPNPTSTYWDAVDELFLVFERGDVPADCRTLAEMVGRFSREHEKFNTFNDETGSQYPHDDFFAAIHAIRHHIDGVIQAPLKPLETIKELVEQKVPFEQIAKIYGFKDKRGTLLPWLVQREIDKPGSVLNTPGAIDGRDWRDPRLPPETKDDEEGDDSLSRKTRAAADDQKPCPETPKELWEQQVSPKQAAKMLRRPIGEVEQLFETFDRERESQKASAAKTDPKTTKGEAKTTKSDKPEPASVATI